MGAFDVNLSLRKEYKPDIFIFHVRITTSAENMQTAISTVQRHHADLRDFGSVFGCKTLLQRTDCREIKNRETNDIEKYVCMYDIDMILVQPTPENLKEVLAELGEKELVPFISSVRIDVDTTKREEYHTEVLKELAIKARERGDLIAEQLGFKITGVESGSYGGVSRGVGVNYANCDSVRALDEAYVEGMFDAVDKRSVVISESITVSFKMG